jgi:hypothetical protein
MENKTPSPAVAEPGASSAIVVESNEASNIVFNAKPDASLSDFELAERAYHRALARFDALPASLEFTDEPLFKVEEDLFIDAVRAVDLAPCHSWAEFGRAFLIASDDGHSIPLEKVILKLVADAKRLAVHS